MPLLQVNYATGEQREQYQADNQNDEDYSSFEDSAEEGSNRDDDEDVDDG